MNNSSGLCRCVGPWLTGWSTDQWPVACAPDACGVVWPLQASILTVCLHPHNLPCCFLLSLPAHYSVCGVHVRKSDPPDWTRTRTKTRTRSTTVLRKCWWWPVSCGEMMVPNSRTVSVMLLMATVLLGWVPPASSVSRYQSVVLLMSCCFLQYHNCVMTSDADITSCFLISDWFFSLTPQSALPLPVSPLQVTHTHAQLMMRVQVQVC